MVEPQGSDRCLLAWALVTSGWVSHPGGTRQVEDCSLFGWRHQLLSGIQGVVAKWIVQICES